MMQLDLIVLTKRKEMIRYCESFGYDDTLLSNIIANDLAHISVLAERWLKYTLRRSSTFVPTSCP
jgi:hypothetical protein